MRTLLSLALTAAVGTSAQAAIVVDGTLDAAYGVPLSVQTVQTGFGDEDGAAGTDGPNGGELDAAYVALDGDSLKVFISGNLETDSFNKLSLFIDSKAGGENTLAPQAYDFGDVGNNLGAITFVSGFDADYHVFARAGGGNFEVDFVDRQGGGATVLSSTGSGALSGDFGTASGVTGGAGNGAAVTGPVPGAGVAFALDNSNTAGVLGGNGPADQVAAAAVSTGVEFSIPLSVLGAGPGDMVSFVAGYSNGDYNFWSNQFLGGLPAGTDNLGADGAGNFFGDASQVALDLSGATPFSITIPEPSTALLAGVALVGLARARRS
ncbi:MAG: PEP-CTERM sorting domain-containing protein [Planctomycetota bacterium]